MSLFHTILLPLISLTFAVWAFLMFRTLFDQRRRAVKRTGRQFPGPIDTLAEWRHWLTTPERARDRKQLLAATLVLFTLIGLTAFIASTDAIPTLNRP